MVINKIKDFFNWKKFPANVFYLAIPLALIGFSCEFMIAYLHWKNNGDMVYAYIVFAGMILLGIGLWPIRKFLLEQINA